MASEILKTWRTVIEELNTLDEKQLLDLLREEYNGQRRQTILTVLHSRYCKLRAQRERKALLAGNWVVDSK